MRPDALQPLFADVQGLDGVGPKIAAYLAKLLPTSATATTPRVIDVLWHMPSGLIDRRAQPSVAAALPGTIATLCVEVGKHRAPPRGSKAPYRIKCSDASGTIDLVYFRADPKFLEGLAPEGSTRIVSGRIEAYGEALQMAHPDHVVAPEDADALALLEPVYPLTAGLAGKTLGKAVRGALERLPDLDEWLDAALVEREGWLNWSQSLTALHRPQDPSDVSNLAPPWQRLAYDEVLAHQLTLQIVRAMVRRTPGRSVVGDGRLSRAIADALPFKMTGSQTTALDEIYADLAAPTTMLRLLQGDVGSGKTVVALMAMAPAIEMGAQAALMAPTEVLARQHLETIGPLAEAVGLRVGLITGREKGVARRQVLSLLAEGALDILIGTHALFQPDVVFHDLGLAVIDEQHRFGVQQRMALQQKGAQSVVATADEARQDMGANVLVMTATPIPRTLLMTHYGDLDVSRLTEKPAGRKPVVTRVVPNDRIEDVIQGLRRALAEGAQAYWVCPLVEGTGKSELAAAEERFAQLRQIFGERIGLVHGQMSGTAKDAAMAAFSANELAILVSTTVIEVGVNVPNASIMVIEHAERFGLAQLHQLRGRVGRGSRASSCILLYAAPLSSTARSRLETMRSTEDGFVIAEEDLRLRGGGEMLGTRQSGTPEFRVAQVPNAKELLEMAHDEARLLVEQDPHLSSPRGRRLRVLLHLWECDAAIRLFRAG